MKLRGKLLLVAVLPLVVSLLLTAFALRQHQAELARRQAELVRASLTETVQAELRHQVALALSTISPLYNTGRNDAEIKRAAMRQLAQLDYGPDGYFFLYDYDGTNLMHPRQPELIGRNLLGLRDTRGLAVIRTMIDKARSGGGFVHYTWNKPSIREVVPKIAYVTGLERWQWMIGTGMYTDDIDHTLSQVERQIEANVIQTLEWLGLAGLAAVAIGFAAVLGVGWSELRAADAKLTLVARQLVRSQEDERAWLARELHDGTSQTLAAAKLLTESALERLPPEHPTRPPLLRVLQRLGDAIHDVRHFSHQLRPAELDSLGLGTALRDLADSASTDAGLQLRLHVPEALPELPDAIRTTLFRVAQEALTNVLKHARARQLELELQHGPAGLELRIADDGRGFDSEAVAGHPQRGIGLRNMRERLHAIGGALHVDSSPLGTELRAQVPQDVIERFIAQTPAARPELAPATRPAPFVTSSTA